MQNYECHITINKEDATIGEMICQTLHWKWSCIDGDPVLGKKAFGYLTSHAPSYELMELRMKLALRALREEGVAIIREKIEHIVYDVRH